MQSQITIIKLLLAVHQIATLLFEES